jgi:eukaryotic-like serine/threonine-protein kinase
MKPERYKQIEELYHSALGRMPEDRAAFLEQSCRGDKALRGEVESLLGYEERAEQFIESPPDDVAVAMLAAEQKQSMVGRTLGHYRVVSLLGSGGMGEVYRATDTRLDRTVALKVLPQHLSSDPERRQRFEREARAVSSLSHPHICALYDIGQQDGIDYLVMEYIEGESLADRLARGPLPADQALRYGIQVADALDKAHRAGIIHRDFKPANVMLTKTGAKLLDFGLAKLHASETEAVIRGQSNLPTEQMSLTTEGTIVGTLQYMAPEQLEAGAVDARTDIFAFGAVLYEMITGRKAFSGKSQANLIAAILSSEPQPVSTVQPMAPPTLDRVVKTCLAKDPDERWQTAHDLMLELKWIAEAGSEASTAAPVVVRGRNRERLAWIVAGVLLGLVAVLLFVIANLRRAPTEVSATRFVISASEKQGLHYPSISPDGRRLVYPASTEGKQQLWIRNLDSVTPQLLTGTDRTSYPAFWSPDGRNIGFFADGKLKKLQLSGGPVQPLTDAPNPLGGSWNREGVIIFAPDGTSPLYRMSANGGERTQLTTLDESRQEHTHRWPLFLPDGHHFLYLARSPQRENTAIYLGSLDSKETKRVLTADSNVAYAPQGYLLFAREGTLMAQPFDVDKLVVTGDEFSVVEQISSMLLSTMAGFSVSENGVLAYVTGNPTVQLTWFDRSGTQLRTVGNPFGIVADKTLPADYLSFRLSPDEKRVAVSRIDPPAVAPDISLIELTRGVASKLTSEPRIDDFPVLSPDGSQIAFSSNREGAMNLYWKLASGAGKEEGLLKSNQAGHMQDWSPDGRFLLYRTYGVKTKSDIWVLPLFGDRKPYPFLNNEFDEAFARFSPDGQWVAYVSDEAGTSEVYVRRFQGSGGSWRISTGGGSVPCWRRIGELFYLSGRKLMAVDVKASDSSFEPGVPKLLFEKSGIRNYEVTRDGQRFLIGVPVEESSPEPITVVLNWTADLKR